MKDSHKVGAEIRAEKLVDLGFVLVGCPAYFFGNDIWQQTLTNPSCVELPAKKKITKLGNF